ncbi:MAG: hypothetical protein GQ570_05795 [Helicobacteraceae bacterium]|nr:hypothetical protein [Helicobacteraceae bacterium]
MRQTLGKIFLIITLFSATLNALDDYKWSVNYKKSSLYQNEALLITYTCKFKDDGYQYVIDFMAEKETSEYKLYILTERDSKRDGARISEFKFVLFAKNRGVLELQLNATMRETTRDSIENSVIGRDNVEEGSFFDTKVMLPLVSLTIKESKNSIVGNLKLTSTINSTSVKAYEPVQFSIKLEGEGNLEDIVPFSFAIDGVNVFGGSVEKNYKLTPSGFKGEVTQKVALVSSKDFMINPFVLEYFNLISQTSKALATKKEFIKVTQIYKKEDLLDEVQERSIEFKRVYLYYLIIFVAGLILGRLSYKLSFKKRKPTTFEEEIQNAKTVEEVHFILALKADIRFSELILKIEKNSKNLNLSKLKKEIKHL